MSIRLRLIASFVVALIFASYSQPSKHYRKIKVSDYVSKMKAGWVGQMVGVGWGGPTEFRWKGEIIPEQEMPAWSPEKVNQFSQDDLYAEMTFLRTLELYGFDVSIRQAGIDFANSQYQLWHANKAGRDNLRSGIAPPWSGFPQYNSHADDIDYQIEADYAGLISPGMPQMAIDLGEKFGRLMNYGDGLYGGQFIAGMYTEAFFENDIKKIIRAGLACIPEGSQYHECISDVLSWYQKNPDDWQKTWQLIKAKYQDNPGYRKFSCSKVGDAFNIDAKINGAYIVMGLLYGRGDPDSTVILSTRCGQDSDCNPSNAGGILFTTIGYENLPEQFTSAIDSTLKFSFTDYNFPELVQVCEKLARQAVLKCSGKIEKDNDGEEWFYIPATTPRPGKLEQSWQPEAVAQNVNFAAEEMEKIKIRSRKPAEFVRIWQVAGPYEQQGADYIALFDIPFPPETGSGYINWKKAPIGEPGFNMFTVQFDRIYGGENRVAYMKTRFQSNSARTAILEIGSDDGVKVWLNGELVHALNMARGFNPGEDKVTVKIKNGWNDLLLKITQGAGGWEASLCIFDENGKAITDFLFE